MMNLLKSALFENNKITKAEFTITPMQEPRRESKYLTELKGLINDVKSNGSDNEEPTINANHERIRIKERAYTIDAVLKLLVFAEKYRIPHKKIIRFIKNGQPDNL